MRPLVARKVFVASAALLLGGCVEVVGLLDESRTDVAVRTTYSVVQADFSSVTDFRVPVELTNLGPGWVVYDRWCGWRIEQLINGSWVAAYYPVCNIYSPEFYSIAPGQTYYETIPAHASWREPIGGSIEGTYRVVWNVEEELDGPRYVRLREDRTTSNSFIVRY